MQRIIQKIWLLILAASLSSCFQLFDPGPATLIKTVLNRSKKKQAILFLKGGNATEDDSMQVSVMDANYKLSGTEVGNTFTTDSNHGLGRTDPNAIRLVWLDDDTLEIDYDKNLRTFIQLNKINHVTVVYKTF